ncbi:MAG: nodulation S family protein [Nanoarchaeota archaeon]|nr:nodulation S family protein [Nanoarchaeota archaeon]
MMSFNSLLLKDPEKYGILFDIFRRSSNEGDVLFERFMRHVRVTQDGSGSLLDIGAADGTLTQRLMPYFAKIVAIDRTRDNAYALSALGIKTHLGLWEQFETDEKFDMVIASHVLYYFGESQYIAECQRIRDSIAPNGVAFVAVNSHDGQYADFMTRFYPEMNSGLSAFEATTGLENNLKANGVLCDTEKHSFSIRFENEIHFAYLCSFFLNCEVQDMSPSLTQRLQDYYMQELTPQGPQSKYMNANIDLHILYNGGIQ